MPIQAGPRPVIGPSGVQTTPQRKLGDVRVDRFAQLSIAYTFPTGAENFNNVLQVQSDAHFLCMSTAYTNDHEIGISGAGVGVPWLRVINGGAIVELTDVSTGIRLQNIQLPVCSLFGSGELPHIWEFTHLFKANTQIGINITGMGAAAPFAGQTLRLVFTGMKVPVGTLPALGL